MKRIKTFESFAMENFDDPDSSFVADGSTYQLYMFDQTVENFSGEVRSPDGQCVYTIDKKTLDDGAMQTAEDITGLRKFLIEKKKLKETDVIEMAQSAPVQTANQTN